MCIGTSSAMAAAVQAAAMEAAVMEAVGVEEAVAMEEALAMEAVMESQRVEIAGPAAIVRSTPKPTAAPIGGAASRGAGQQYER